MGMLKSTIELEELHKRIQNNLAKSANKIQVKVHLGTCGISSGANQTLSAFEKEVSARNLSQVVISQGTCIGLCGQEPTVTIIHPQLGKTIYTSLTQDKVPAVIEEHLLGNKIVSQWAIKPQSPRLALQEIRILHNQDINPWSIEEYIARGGYLALA